MSILGRRALIEHLRGGQLAVSPLLSPDQVGTSSIDLRMGNIALMARARGSSHVDPALAKSDLGGSTDGIAGMRINHNLDLHIANFKVDPSPKH